MRQTMMDIDEELLKSKMRSTDRILVLRPIEGSKAKSSTGLVDPRLFKGDNNLHAIMDPMGLWYCRLDQGVIPPELKQQFTSFAKLLKHIQEYYKTRNIEIVEVKD